MPNTESKTESKTESNKLPANELSVVLPNLSHAPSAQTSQDFSQRLLAWFDEYGRHDLPWQQHKTDSPDAYKVWISEVMLQQTQVTTVIPYFTRFMSSFPTIQHLADASWEQVADHWAGLGYYARARNLHKGAKQLVAIIDDTGNLPQTVDEWEQISGVGRSTAGAIVAMGLHNYGVICDGNVKRVLTRWSAIDGDITKSATTKELWQLAETLTPTANSGHFAQAMMDMGATLCHRTKPACITKVAECPIQADCKAFAMSTQKNYPVKAKKKPKPSKYSHVLLLTNSKHQLLWLQRPDTGIWGGLWCLPMSYVCKKQAKKVLETGQDDSVYEKEFTTAEQVIDEFFCAKGGSNKSSNEGGFIQAEFDEEYTIKHTLTHFHWYLATQLVELSDDEVVKLTQRLIATQTAYKWLTADEANKQLALPKAMDKVLDGLKNI